MFDGLYFSIYSRGETDDDTPFGCELPCEVISRDGFASNRPSVGVVLCSGGIEHDVSVHKVFGAVARGNEPKLISSKCVQPVNVQ